MRLFTLVFTLIIVLGSFYAKAATYYVSTTGNDYNTGITQKSAWASIAKINTTTFSAGDTVLFEGGAVFTGSIFFGPNIKGTSSQPIVLGSFGKSRAVISSGIETGLYVQNTAGIKIKNLVFQGSGRETSQGSGIYFYMNLPNTRLAYIAIDSVEAYGYRESGIRIGSWSGTSGFDDVSITNSSTHDNGDSGIKTFADNYKIGHKNFYVAHCKAYNNSGNPDRTDLHSGNGIVLGGIDGAIIEYCEAYNNGWLNAWKDGGPVGIWGYLCNNLIIQYNESHHNKTGTTKDGGGFDIDGGSTNSIMQYNYSHDNEGAGYLLAQFDYAPTMKNIIIRYNISENDGRKNGYGAIHLWSSTAGNTQAIQNAQIYNNTVYLSPAPNGTPKAVVVQSGGTTAASFRNNIFVTTGGLKLMDIQVTPNIRFEGNNYWASGAASAFTWAGKTYTSLPDWRGATSQELRNGIDLGYSLNPELKNPGLGITVSDPRALQMLQGYELKKNSRMVGKALDLRRDFNLNSGDFDFWGNSITQRSDLCIGAHQLTDNSKACLQGGLLPLAFGASKEGQYSGSGVLQGNLFDPSAAGTGNKALSFTYLNDAGQQQVLHHTVTVVDATATEWTGKSGTTNWFEAENWSQCIPTAKIDAIIPSSAQGAYILPIVKAGEHAFTHNLSATGTLTVNSGGILELSNQVLTSNLTAAPQSNIVFSSNATQYIPAGTFGKLVLQGTGEKKLAGAVKVLDLLDLGHTKLVLGDHTLAMASTGSISNYSPHAYLVTDGEGKLTYEAIGPGKTRVFPIGTKGSYAPVRLGNEGIMDNFSIRVEEGFKSYTPEGTLITEGVVNKTWHVTEEVVGGSDVSMNLQWNASDELPNFIRDASHISHFENGQWNLVENSVSTVTQGTAPNTYSINIKGVKSFSPFAVASNQTSPIPLPVTLLTFTATQRDFGVVLKWATASEQDNSGFEVEVSEDGKQYRKLGFVKSHSENSQMIQLYSFEDLGIREEGTRYYRLRQIDLDGTATYSSVVVVAFDKTDFVLSAYPNPFSDIISLELESKKEQQLLLTVTDTQGRKLFEKSIYLKKGLLKLPIDLSKVPASSMCVVTAYYNNTAYHYKLFKK